MWDQILFNVEKINNVINGLVWGWPAIVLILGTGILLTLKTKFLQIRHFSTIINETILNTFKGLGKKKKLVETEKSISQFEAFSTAISGTVGTGNIIGVIAAILAGGPGAVFWMWVSAFFGMITKYSESVLGIYFRKKDKDGNFSGGPFYYIANGLKSKWLAYCSAIFCIFAAIGMSGVQSNKISGTLSSSILIIKNNLNPGIVKSVIGIVVALITAVIIIGGIQRIGKVTSKLVPFMSLLFIVMSFIAIISHFYNVPNALALIFSKAFNFRAVGSGILGYSFTQAITKGMARGIFSNESGLGSSVIAHSASETHEPVTQGFWGIFEVFFDTFIICTLTALTFLSTFDLTKCSSDIDDTTMAMTMFSSNFGSFGTIAFSIILPLFAFTTIIAWSYYGEKATEFCFNKISERNQKVAVVIFKIVYTILIAVSATVHNKLIWDIDDTFNGLMAVPNLICLVSLSRLVVKISKNYFDRKRGLNVEPMLSAYQELNDQ